MDFHERYYQMREYDIILYAQLPFKPQKVRFGYPPWSHFIDHDETEGEFFRQLAETAGDIHYNPWVANGFDTFPGQGTVFINSDTLMVIRLLLGEHLQTQT